MGNGAQDARSEAVEQHTLLAEALEHAFRLGDRDEVRLDLAHVDGNARVRETFGETACARRRARRSGGAAV